MNKAELTISRPSYSDGNKLIHISIKDKDARVQFLELKISYSDFTEALTGMAFVECDMEFRSLDCVGKMIEKDTLTFPMPLTTYSNRVEVAIRESSLATPDGWTTSSYFGSKESFFTEDGKDYARTTISRWVDKPQLQG